MFRLRVDDEIELSLPEDADAGTVFALIDANRAFIGRHLRWMETARTVDDTRAWIRQVRRAFATGDQVTALIWHRGEFAGVVDLWHISRPSRWGEIGYWLGETFTGKGIMTRTVRAFVDYAFKAWGLHRIAILCTTENPKSAAVPERLGFVHEAVLRDARFLHDRRLSFAVYGMLADEWPDAGIEPHFSFRVDDELALRLMEPRDTEALHKLLIENRDHVARWEGWVEYGSSYSAILSFTHSFLRRWADGRGFAAGLYAHHDGRALPVGNITYRIEDNRSVEMGYWLDEGYTGRGYITRTLRALLDYGLVTCGLPRAALVISTGNTPSRAVAERLGFRQEAVLRGEELLHGRYVDRAIYGLMADEWKTKRGTP
jgi:ribosomal-protein-serine acetyltransferase